MQNPRASILAAAGAALLLTAGAAPPKQAELGRRTAPLIRVDGLAFKDLDRNGRLDPYEDWRRTPAERAADLVARMTLEEKAGLLMHGTPPAKDGGPFGPWDLDKLRGMIQQQHVVFLIHRLSGDPAVLAQTANAVQAMAEDTRLGVPVTFSSDPRNHFTPTFGLSVEAGRFSQWPEPPGLAATGDPALVRRFGKVAAREYRAIGVRMALSPMADLATEPRWARNGGVFGDDPDTVAPFVRAYIEGFQGGAGEIGPESVACVVKHWVGYGAEPGGFDAHNPYGRDLAFPAGRFGDHVKPFLGAFAAHVAGVMPTYGRPPAGLMVNGRPAERVGAGFSRQMLTELLRGVYGFKGIVLTDWKVTDDCGPACEAGVMDIDQVGMPWGVESLSKDERFAKALEAGVDQFGGVSDPEVIVRLVRRGQISEARIDASARRLLAQTFALGLFENPYVDPQAAARIVGAPAFVAAGLEAQRRSLVLLENRGRILPLAPSRRRKVWLWNVSPAAARARGFVVVDRPEDADVAIVRIAAPFTPRPGYFFGSRQHEGSLVFGPDNPDRQAVERASAHAPTIVSAFLDRPAILTPIRDRASALVADFGVTDQALLDVLTSRGGFHGRLPFELPSSEAAVERQAPDAPHDSDHPLYRTGYGRRF